MSASCLTADIDNDRIEKSIRIEIQKTLLYQGSWGNWKVLIYEIPYSYTGTLGKAPLHGVIADPSLGKTQ